MISNDHIIFWSGLSSGFNFKRSFFTQKAIIDFTWNKKRSVEIKVLELLISNILLISDQASMQVLKCKVYHYLRQAKVIQLRTLNKVSKFFFTPDQI